MDGNKQGKRKKKRNPSGNKTSIEYLETKLDETKISSNQIKNNSNLVTNESKSTSKSIKTAERENLQNNPQNSAAGTSHSKNNAKIVGGNKNVTTSKKTQKKPKPKKKKPNKSENEVLLDEKNNEVMSYVKGGNFEFEDVLNNPNFLELIQDLVNCFISSSTLPENEMETLKMSLCERTFSVFINLLNNCVNKTFVRVLNSNFVRGFQKKSVSKVDACCQTILM